MIITKEDVGKKVWNNNMKQYGIIFAVNENITFPVRVAYHVGGSDFVNEYKIDGKLLNEQILMWRKPLTPVTKKLIAYGVVDLDTDELVGIYDDKEIAENKKDHPSDEVVELVGAYQNLE